MLGFETVNKYIERHIIEVAPLAFMRGRTLNHAFIILDEAQNTTKRANENVPDANWFRVHCSGHRRYQSD